MPGAGGRSGIGRPFETDGAAGVGGIVGMEALAVADDINWAPQCVQKRAVSGTVALQLVQIIGLYLPCPLPVSPSH